MLLISSYFRIESAKSARRYLLNRNYGPRYSHFHKELYGKNEAELFQYIASRDGYLPKGFRLYYGYNYAGYHKKYFNLQTSVSSVSEVTKLLMMQFEEYLEEMDKQKKNADSSQWSSENIVEALKINVNEREQVEANLVFKLGGYKRFFAMDNHTINALPRMMKEVLNVLREGKPFGLVRFINRYKIEMSYPTEMAFPLLFSFNIPTVLGLAGTVKVNTQPELSNGDKLRLPEIIDSEGDLNFLLSLKVQAELGFLTPHDHHNYLSVYEKDTQLHLPFKHKIRFDLNNNEIRTQLAFRNPEKTTKLAYYRSRPYVAHFDILQLKPVLSSSDHQLVGLPPRNYYNMLYGKESVGMAFRFKYEGDDKFLDFRWLYDQIKRAKNYVSLVTLWEKQNVGMRKLCIEYVGEQSRNKEVMTSFMYYNNTYETPQMQNVDIQQVYEAPIEANARLVDFGKKASAGIINANVVGLQANIYFKGEQSINYDATAVYSSSKVDDTSRMLLYWSRNPEVNGYRMAASFKNHFPSLSELDPEKVLESDISSTISADFVFGHEYQSATHLDGQLKLRRSDKRTEYLKYSREYKECQKEMQLGNKQLYNCELITLSAKYPDSISMQWRYKNLDSKMYNSTAKAYSWFRYYNFYNSYENYAVDQEKQDEVGVNVDFDPDYSAANVSVDTPSYRAFYENIRMEWNSYEEWPLSYWTLSHLPWVNYFRRK